MDITPAPWLNPTMRFGVFAASSRLALPGVLLGQDPVRPSILQPPANVAVHVGDTATLSAVLEGTPPLSFQWFKDGALLAGATNSTLTITAAALTDNFSAYYLVATNAAGSITSTPASFSVTKRPQTITFTAPAAVLAAGSGVTLAATSSLNLPVTLSLVSGNAALAGNVLTSSGGNVLVRASQAGNASIAAADSVERTITFVAGALSPFITSPPADQTITAGASATFRAAAIGTPAPTYQWQKDGVILAGATSASLTLANTTLADRGRYSVVATNLAGSATAVTTLAVRAAPVLTTMPADRTVAAGEVVSWTAVATGFPAPAFQWRRNNTAIAAATNAVFTLASAAPTDAGRYDVVATNALGSVTSTAATLTVTTRDFSGVYFGTLAVAGDSGAVPGSFALLVRANGTAAFLGQIAASDGALAALDLPVDRAGNFTRSIVAGARTLALRGRLDDTTGELSGTIAELGVMLAGTRAPRTGVASAQAGLYPFAIVGSAAARGHAILAADGQAFVLLTNGTASDSARGALGTDSQLALATSSQSALSLAFNNGALSGTVRTGSITATAAGALESLTGSEHLSNLSVRSQTQITAPLITGFVVGGTTPKQVLIRAAGPAIAQAPFNVAGALADPTLQVFRGNNIIAQNDEWSTPPANGAAVTAALARTGAFPFRPGSTDAALVATLPPGPYTVMIGGGNGTVLAEIYEVLESNEAIGARRLVNTSARGLVFPGNPLIAGFVITGAAPQRVLIRGLGSALGAPPFNVPGALQNPQLTLFRDSTIVKTNDDWFRDAEAATIRNAAVRAGAFVLGAQSPDAAILIYLSPGAYTAQVSGPTNATANNGIGIALVEVYEATP